MDFVNCCSFNKLFSFSSHLQVGMWNKETLMELNLTF